MESPQEEEFRPKTRLTVLKDYLDNLHGREAEAPKPSRCVPDGENQGLPLPKSIKKGPGEFSSENSLITEIQRLKKQVQIKSQFICGTSNKTINVLSQSNRSICFSALIYHSKFQNQEPLNRIGEVMSDQDLQIGGIYTMNDCLVVLNSNTLEVLKVLYKNILRDSIENYKKFVKINANSVGTQFFLFKFPSAKDAALWYRFLMSITVVQCSSKNLSDKWRKTNIHATNQIFSQSSIENRSKTGENLPKEITLSNSDKISFDKNDNPQKKVESPKKKQFQGKNVSQILKKESEQSLTFFFSAESDINNFGLEKQKSKNDQLTESIGFYSKVSSVASPDKKQIRNNLSKPSTLNRNPSQLLQTVKEEDIPVLKRSEDLEMTKKVKNKWEEKKKLLADSSATKLNIYWHEQIQTKSNLFRQKTVTSEADKNDQSSTKQVSGEKKNLRISIRKSSQKRDNPINFIPFRDRDYNDKQIHSAIRIKSKSKEEGAAIIHDALRIRKLTDFSLKCNRQRQKSVQKKSKNQIRDHYLQKLLQKQAVKDSSYSGHSVHDFSRTDLKLVPIPERRTPSISNTGSNKNSYKDSNTDVDKNDSDFSRQSISDSSSQDRESTEQQIQIRQLKNGIMILKCSRNAWSAKQKKLYLSKTATQLCYHNPMNPIKEKCFFIKDILNVEYKGYSQGILKHRKNFQDIRCLLIQVMKDNKQKTLEFYLEESEPASALQDFANKLNEFLQRQSDYEDEIQI